MKAIVLTFEGEINQEQELMELFAKAMAKCTEASNIDVSILNDTEIALLTKQTVNVKDPKIEVIRDFCKKIIAEVGPAALKKDEILYRDITGYLIKQNKAVIACPLSIIADIPTEPNHEEYEKILKAYGLSILPRLLRDINPIFKFY